MRLVRSVSRADAVSVRNQQDVLVRYRGSDGQFVDTSLDRLPVDEVLAGLPVREFRSYRERRHNSGWYWSATTGGHVVYESRLELARILLADHDSGVVAIAAQPLLLEGLDGERTRRHVPDVMLGHADGAVTVVDVKAASRLDDPKVSAQFAWTKQLCDRRGFRFQVWSGADPVLLENVRFLAGYRRPMVIAEELVPLVLEASASRRRFLPGDPGVFDAGSVDVDVLGAVSRRGPARLTPNERPECRQTDCTHRVRVVAFR